MYQIVGCAKEVLNELGHGLHEKGQVFNYLRISAVRLGIVLNSTRAKLD